MHARVTFLLVSVMFINGCGPGPGEAERVLQEVTAHAVEPLHAGFVASSRVLGDAAKAFCAEPSAGSLETARSAWRDAMRDWQRLQVISFGPVTIDNQAWKVQFWPDKNNLVARQVEALLAGEEPLSAERLESASVVVQGLTAAEYLLFDEEGGSLTRYKDTQNGAARSCRLLALVAAHTLGVAEYLERGWSPEGDNYAATFTAPGDANPDFPTQDDALAALLDSVLAAIETAKNDKLAEPLGLRNDLGVAQPYAVEAWRSGDSLALLLATVDGARQLYYAGGRSEASVGVDDLLRARELDELAEKIDQAFDKVNETAPDDLVLFDAVNDAAQVDALTDYHEALTGLTGLVKNELPAALGITLGFNDKDGD